METQNIVVIGIGRVGLPLALVLADKGHKVIGVDINIDILGMIWINKMPFIEEGASPLLEKYQGNRFVAVHEKILLPVTNQADIIIITLGTPIDANYSPNFSQINDFFQKVGSSLKKGQLIILRSTISPGVTKHIKNYLEEKLHFTVGEDIFLAYCPERIAEGKAIEELSQIPQIIGTFDARSASKAGHLFSQITQSVLFTDPLSAELAKLYCNIYRYIDFAIGNEFMMIAEDQNADIYEVLRLANNGYKRSGIKSPGFTAGPCLVKDSFFLLDKSPYLELMTAAWRINENIPGFILKSIKSRVGELSGKNVAILGLAFKKDIDDSRYSLTPKLRNHFLSENSEVSLHDPYLETSSLEEVLQDADIVIIATNHEIYKNISPFKYSEHVKKDCIFFDIWNLYGTGKILFSVQELFGMDELKNKSKEQTEKSNGLQKPLFIHNRKRGNRAVI